MHVPCAWGTCQSQEAFSLIHDEGACRFWRGGCGRDGGIADCVRVCRGVVERVEKSKGKAKIAFEHADGSERAEWVKLDAGRLREVGKEGKGDKKRKSEGGGAAARSDSAKKSKPVLPSCPKVRFDLAVLCQAAV